MSDKLPQGWVETTLGEVAEIIMGQSPKGETCNVTGNGMPLLNGPTEFGDKSPSAVQFTIDARKKSKNEDLLFCVRGSTTGRMNWADKEYAIGRGIAAIRHRKGTEYKHFIKAVFDYKLPVLLSSATGSTFPNVSRSQLEELVISLPPHPEQKAIAAVLSAFDDKIELLREQNETLETLAQTIFKEWFVHFNFPDQNGKPYRDNGGEMVDSELGEIPKGWRVGEIGDILELLYGKPLKATNRTGAGFPVYGSNGVVGYHKDYFVKGPGIIIGRKGSMGEVTWCNENFHPIDTTFYVSDLLNVSGMFFHYFLLKRYDFERIGSDSAVPGLNRNAVYSIDLVIPSLNIIEMFNNVANIIFQKTKNNTAQIQTLSKTRDTLLPKLMSGEIRVTGE